ncbi:DUF2797 domain-containing protein [Halovenus sp. WSH3]|uniref:DUF2797 domain-containing protein n=1 Tax=Halovenus carboxidivorans TaxID=2692199 RepID=A0A6B0T458_9EURY|nr:DUF2797 domain-containing protein [Halovenus carboxidivorans]
MQIVGYETAAVSDDEAGLLIAEAGDVRTEPLSPGTELSYRLGRRHCAGAIEYESGRHTRCERDRAPYCDRHTTRWACARCTGDCDLPLESCREDHAVYLAAFAPATFKVGVTRSWRLQTRLREQGADRAAHIRTVDNGRIARQIEAEIATEIGDRVRVPTKRRGLHRSVDSEKWDRLLDGYDPVETFEFEYGLEFDERPMGETIASGTVRGTKGRLLVLDREGSVYAVDLRDLVGHELSAGETDRALQSSFSAFE